MSLTDLADWTSENTEVWLGSSEMAWRVREFDWAATPLGSIGTWPQSLKSAVAISLRSPFQMAVYWGPELNCIYNDAERDILGNLHPGALGLPARELLRDSWELVGPQLEAVIARGDSTWAEDRPLRFNRRGGLEVSYFTYSYSPILDDECRVGGVLLVTQDTTARVLAERRIDAVRKLVVQSLDAPAVRDACAQCCHAMTQGEDFPFALLYLIEGDRATCVAAREAGRPLAASRQTVRLEHSADEVSILFRTLRAARSGAELVPASLFTAHASPGRIPSERALVVPLAGGTRDPIEGFLVAGLREDLMFDAAYAEFVDMVAVAVGRGVAAARSRETERQRMKEIAALSRAKTNLFGNASHELRTPLALIIGQLEQIAEDRELPRALCDAVGVAHRSAIRMLKLINALLDFSRIDLGENIGAFQKIDAAQLTADVAAMFQSAAGRAGLRLIVDCPALPEQVCLDPDAWETIVSNLVSNALKFTAAGEIRIRTRADGEQLCLIVEDTGIGIAREDLGRVFSRFYRSADPRTRTHEGSGIGLALVHELVLLHQGSIDVESQLDHGTRVTVRVPMGTEGCPGEVGRLGGPGFATQRSAELSVAEAEAWFEPSKPAIAPAPAANHDPDDVPSVGRRQEPPWVLVVEDSADMGEYLRRLLAPHYLVQLARDGREAREILSADSPSLVISDVMLPDLDGFDLIQELRSSARSASLPVVLVSAQAEPQNTLRALELGADDYIIKPFGARELLARVHATLENARARADAAAAQGRFEERTRHEGELRVLLNELRAAQRRVAVAGDAERRRIERDLHDGAQQRLMALRLELGLVEERLKGDDPNRAVEMLTELRPELDEALEELRELAHGLYPPRLASDGLEAALAAAARRSVVPVTIEAIGMTRAPRAIESTAYFCCLEALQNVAKHAGTGAQATIELRTQGRFLNFSVRDDGGGFDPRVMRPGQGLTNLRDRLQALGGDACVSSSPGVGTTVSGHIPLP